MFRKKLKGFKDKRFGNMYYCSRKGHFDTTNLSPKGNVYTRNCDKEIIRHYNVHINEAQIKNFEPKMVEGIHYEKSSYSSQCSLINPKFDIEEL